MGEVRLVDGTPTLTRHRRRTMGKRGEEAREDRDSTEEGEGDATQAMRRDELGKDI